MEFQCHKTFCISNKIYSIAWGLYPTMKKVDDCQYDLCLDVDFQDNGENERIILKEKANNCVYTGSFEQTTSVSVKASSMNCPILESSILQVISYLFL